MSIIFTLYKEKQTILIKHLKGFLVDAKFMTGRLGVVFLKQVRKNKNDNS